MVHNHKYIFHLHW